MNEWDATLASAIVGAFGLIIVSIIKFMPSRGGSGGGVSEALCQAHRDSFSSTLRRLEANQEQITSIMGEMREDLAVIKRVIDDWRRVGRTSGEGNGPRGG